MVMEEKILYIEDNPNNMQLVEKIVRSRGYALLRAENGEMGIELAVTEEPDLILLDINLPDIDGYEVARRLRAGLLTRRVPIVAVTANALVGDDKRALLAGCDDYLTKPINLRDLLACVQKYLPPAG